MELVGVSESLVEPLSNDRGSLGFECANFNSVFFRLGIVLVICRCALMRSSLRGIRHCGAPRFPLRLCRKRFEL